MGWRSDTRRVIRQYPELRRREASLHDPTITPLYSPLPAPGNASRMTETLALRELPPQEQRELAAVSSAVSTTMRYRNGTLRVRLIDMVYWERACSLEGAAIRLHVSIDTAKKWHTAFIELVDAYLRVL